VDSRDCFGVKVTSDPASRLFNPHENTYLTAAQLTFIVAGHR
jgi:hypothetical protein